MLGSALQLDLGSIARSMQDKRVLAIFRDAPEHIGLERCCSCQTYSDKHLRAIMSCPIACACPAFPDVVVA